MGSENNPISFLDICPDWALKSDDPLQTGTITRTDLKPAPLQPNWILKGNPTARSLQLGEATDGNLSFGLWDCTEGQFIFKYRSDELVHILEGEATVRGPGTEINLQPGAVAFFPKGSTMHWTVHRYIKKLAIFRSTPLGLLARIKGLFMRVWQNFSASK